MAGCYGKIPALGDFLSRNLPGTFIDAWDGWLRRIMATSAHARDAVWVDRYLSAPIWRFALSPGVVGPTGRGGILVPSVDSVGRYFPLTIAVEIPEGVAAADMATAWGDGYERAEMLAIGAIGRALEPEAFVERVVNLPNPMAVAPAEPPVAGSWSQPPAPHMGVRRAGAPAENGNSRDVASSLALSMLAGSLQGFSLWWHLDWENRPATTVMFNGLPPPDAACGMLLGAWEDWGWSG